MRVASVLQGWGICVASVLQGRGRKEGGLVEDVCHWIRRGEMRRVAVVKGPCAARPREGGRSRRRDVTEGLGLGC
jgi:hypothetical protein